jgi:hypothetical protein
MRQRRFQFRREGGGHYRSLSTAPERALVISVDEKPSIQALSRTTGYVRTSSGKIVRGLKSAYRRNGTLNLYAALNVATGEVRQKTTKTKIRVDFQAFMDALPPDERARSDAKLRKSRRWPS